MTWQAKFGYTMFIMLLWLSVATAATVVNEDGDAGSLRTDAQIVDQRVDLSDGIVEIHGSIIPGNDEDMYRIEISIPSLFSANTNILGSLIEDTRLFVFDENGNGVCANHDNPNALPGDPNASLAVIPQGTCTLLPGTYYIAISTFERYPVFLEGNPFSSIFPDAPRDAVVGPLAVAGPIVGWEGTGQRGDVYIIQLMGINYPPPDCQLVDPIGMVDGNTKTFQYVATDLNLGIASVSVNTLTLALDLDASIPLPEVRIPLDLDQEQVLHEGDSLPIAPPRDTVTMNVFNPNRFSALQSELTVTNSVGGTVICPPIAGRDSDPNPPSCSGPQVIQGELLPTLEEVVQDTESGIQRIEVDFLKNATLTIDGRPAGYHDPEAGIVNPIVFDPPTLRPLTIRAVKIDETERATVVVLIYDADGNESRCDPHVLDETIPAGRNMVRGEVTGLGSAEHHVTVHNHGDGVTLAAVRANQGPLQVRWMANRVEAWMNTAADMVESTDNTMKFLLLGRPGSGALIVIADRPPSHSIVAPSTQITNTLNHLTRQSLRSLKLQNHNWGSWGQERNPN